MYISLFFLSFTILFWFLILFLLFFCLFWLLFSLIFIFVLILRIIPTLLILFFHFIFKFLNSFLFFPIYFSLGILLSFSSILCHLFICCYCVSRFMVIWLTFFKILRRVEIGKIYNKRCYCFSCLLRNSMPFIDIIHNFFIKISFKKYNCCIIKGSKDIQNPF